MNVLVIEQEKIVAQKIKELLFGIDESIRVVGITDNVFTAAEWLNRNTIPDIILANSEIRTEVEKTAGREIKATITFSRGTEELNLRAFRYKTIRHFLNDINGTDEGEDPVHYEPDKFPTSGIYKERFLVKQGQKLLSVPVDQVAYFFSQERFIFFRTFDNQKFLQEYRVEQLEKMLLPTRFFRINRSFIISIPAVKEIHPYFGNRLKLYLSPAAGKDVIVSRKRASGFKAWLGK
ncbi:MAG: DNA-binding response regulator [Chitinophagaceae bacterium]|nr:DNA-binding response regulator [Chitinophagaceae bacterium]